MDRPLTIQILLSTFNGEKYLSQQLDSLLNQNYSNVDILIRDDGSKDETCSILAEYERNHSNITVVYGENIGVLKSYFELVKNANGDLYALCDQDDIWLPSKLSRAVSRIQTCSIPPSGLYCSALQFVDNNLQPIGLTKPPMHRCLENAVMENIATGCTVVFGENLRSLFLQAEPEKMHMHDWWLYLLAAAFGEVVFDPESSVLYRRHDETVTGLQLKSSRTVFARIKGFWGFFAGKRQLYGLKQAVQFGKTYSTQLNREQRKLFTRLTRLYEYNGVWDRIRFASRRTVLFNDRLDNFGVRLLVLLGKY